MNTRRRNDIADTLVRQLRSSVRLPCVLWAVLLFLGSGFVLMGLTSSRESDAQVLLAIAATFGISALLGIGASVRKFRGAPTHPVAEAWRGTISEIVSARRIDVQTNGYLRYYLQMEHRSGKRASLECSEQERLEILSWFAAEGVAGA